MPGMVVVADVAGHVEGRKTVALVADIAGNFAVQVVETGLAPASTDCQKD